MDNFHLLNRRLKYEHIYKVYEYLYINLFSCILHNASRRLNMEETRVIFTLSCKCCDDKQNVLVDKNKAIKLEKIKNEIICDKCIEKGRLK